MVRKLLAECDMDSIRSFPDEKKSESHFATRYFSSEVYAATAATFFRRVTLRVVLRRVVALRVDFRTDALRVAFLRVVFLRPAAALRVVFLRVAFLRVAFLRPVVALRVDFLRVTLRVVLRAAALRVDLRAARFGAAAFFARLTAIFNGVILSLAIQTARVVAYLIQYYANECKFLVI